MIKKEIHEFFFLSKGGQFVWIGLLLGLFLVAFIRTAWVSDDAYITFRVVDNFADGLGLVWNPGERVQVYTHPLWLFLLIPIGLIGFDPYWGSLFLSFAFLVGTLLLLIRMGWASGAGGILTAFLLLASKSFVDYSSSGLENPLLHFLVVLYLLIFLWDKGEGIFFIGVIAGLIFLTRPDALLLILPGFAFQLYRERRDRGFLKLSILPFFFIILVWVLFSIFYYGVPVPNTALAKAGNGFDLPLSIRQGWGGIQWLWRNDPFSLVLVVAAVALGGGSKDARCRIVALSILLWVLYYLYVGGDFMGGRFFSVLVVAGVVILVRELRGGASIKFMLLPLFMASTAVQASVFSPPNYNNAFIDSNGVADERGFYYTFTGGLPNYFIRDRRKEHIWYRLGERFYPLHQKVFVGCTIGLWGYAAGKEAYTIDPFALSDPFLSRLPASRSSRVGHYERALPAGYLESRLFGSNRLENPHLAELMRLVLTVTQGDLWSVERLKSIVRLNIIGPSLVAQSGYNPDLVWLPGKSIEAKGAFSCAGVSSAVWLWRIDQDGGELKATALVDLL
ncbi:hypothetical protein [Pseudomonas indica]|uniref:Arabinofuranosyltransferase n=1 Tax=Pseudomonas indica TaxID=137658 RepID=A0A1G9MAL2_9PSED|nr:hypothetical protein [Pseudomonas indica]SDL70705.1 arabinofuranosyltransferase [Pseudomonas indica]